MKQRLQQGVKYLYGYIHVLSQINSKFHTTVQKRLVIENNYPYGFLLTTQPYFSQFTQEK